MNILYTASSNVSTNPSHQTRTNPATRRLTPGLAGSQYILSPVDLHHLVLAGADDAERLVPGDAEDLGAAPGDVAAGPPPRALEALALDDVDGLGHAAAALGLGAGARAAQVPDAAGAVVRARDEAVVIVGAGGEARHHVPMAAEGKHGRRGGGHARVHERDVARGRRGREEHRGRRRASTSAAQRGQREQRVRRRDGALDLARGQVDGADSVVLRGRVGDAGVGRVETHGRRGRVVDGEHAQGPALRRCGRARELALLRLGGAGAGEQARGRCGRGRFRCCPEADGAVGGGAEHAARGPVDVQRVDARLMPV